MVISSLSGTANPLLMADWLHCNTCFLQPYKGIQFHITTCGHIYCDKCVIKATKDSCRMCASKCSTMQLAGNVKPDVEVYFQDPVEQLNKAMKKCMQVLDFQKNHRRRFITHIKNKLQEQNKMLIDAKKMISSAQAYEREVMKLREENNYLKKLVQEKGFGSGSRPSPRSGCSPTGYRNSPNVSPGMRHTAHSVSRHATPSAVTHSHGRSSSQMSSFPSSSGFPNSQMSITPDRILARTPPSGGRMGTVGNGSPAERQMISLCRTPESVPHPIYTPSFHGTPDTISGRI